MSSFFAELKRRNVFKVGVAYAIVAWLLIQIASILLPTFQAPAWAMRVFALFVILGFPIAVFLAWAYELTPEGIKATSTIDRNQHFTPSTNQRFNYIILGLLVLAVSFMLLDNYVLVDKASEEKGVRSEEEVVNDVQTGSSANTVQVNTGETTPAASITPTNSIAVLPFKDISQKRDQEYFADGLTEELLNKLSQVRDLQVTARTSSFYFKGKDEDIRTIGRTLGVSYLLEGSVRKDADQVRVTAQLIKSEDGYHLWSGTFDRPLVDIFTIQDDIAQAVTRALSITLGVGTFDRPGMTKNVQAYEKYLQSATDMLRNSEESALAAIDSAEQAVQIDPDFALGWLRLQSACVNAINWSSPEKAQDYREQMLAAQQRARAIAPDIPELLLVTAQEYQNTHDWLEADNIFQEILKENYTAEVFQEYGIMLTNLGRTADAIAYLQRAKRLDPVSANVSGSLTLALYNSSEFDEALREINRGLTLGGNEALFYLVRWLIAFGSNDRAQAITIMRRGFSSDDSPASEDGWLVTLLKMDDREAALSEFRRTFYPNRVNSPVTNLSIAHVASELGAMEIALDLINKALETGSGQVASAFWHPIHHEVRQLPGFKTTVRNLGLVDYWRATGNWGDYCHPVGEEDFECE